MESIRIPAPPPNATPSRAQCLDDRISGSLQTPASPGTTGGSSFTTPPAPLLPSRCQGTGVTKRPVPKAPGSERTLSAPPDETDTFSSESSIHCPSCHLTHRSGRGAESIVTSRSLRPWWPPGEPRAVWTPPPEHIRNFSAPSGRSLCPCFP